MSESWLRVVAHAERHHSTIGWADLQRLGVRQSSVESWCARGRLVHAAPGAYVVGGAAPSWEQRLMVATISGAGWASHRAAAALWRLDGFEPRQIEVLTPYARRRARNDWIVHETRRLSGVDLDTVDGIPCTSLVRTLLDLPAVAHPVRVAQALDHACRTRPGTLQATAARFRELASRGRPGTRLMRALLDERLGGGAFLQSGFEARALRLVRKAGLPEPVLQHKVEDGRGFVAYLDLAWPTVAWAIECDSLAHHSGKRAHEWDRRRRRTLKGLGWDIVEITFDDVRLRPNETARDLARLFAARRRSVGGMQGMPVRLSATPPPSRAAAS